jgi:hypothetical protein
VVVVEVHALAAVGRLEPPRTEQLDVLVFLVVDHTGRHRVQHLHLQPGSGEWVRLRGAVVPADRVPVPVDQCLLDPAREEVPELVLAPHQLPGVLELSGEDIGVGGQGGRRLNRGWVFGRFSGVGGVGVGGLGISQQRGRCRLGVGLGGVTQDAVAGRGLGVGTGALGEARCVLGIGERGRDVGVSGGSRGQRRGRGAHVTPDGGVQRVVEIGAGDIGRVAGRPRQNGLDFQSVVDLLDHPSGEVAPVVIAGLHQDVGDVLGREDFPDVSPVEPLCFLVVLGLVVEVVEHPLDVRVVGGRIV